ncbi:MAG: HEAT repeat domain-containing protein [Anaerolineae bacterium]
MTPVIVDLNHPDMQRRYETMSALLQSGSAVVPELTAALSPAHDVEIRWRAAAILGWLGDLTAIPALVEASEGAGYELKYNCIWGLGQIGDKAALPALLTIVQADENESPDVRYNAALALVRLGEVDYLRQAVSSENEGTYRVAHAALATLAQLSR